jgi:hypothetical protein
MTTTTTMMMRTKRRRRRPPRRRRSPSRRRPRLRCAGLPARWQHAALRCLLPCTLARTAELLPSC